MLEAALVRGLTEGGDRRGADRHGPIADALFRDALSRRRRRHPGHRQPQPGRLQRLQDAAERPLGVRRRRSRRSAAASAAGDWTERQRERPRRSTSASLCRPAAGGLFGQALPRSAGTPGNGAAGPVLDMLVERLPGQHHAIFTDGRRPLPQPPSRPDGREESRRPEAAGRRQAARFRHRLRRRRRPDRRGRRQGPRDLGRPAAA